MSEPSRLERWTLKVQGDEEAKISAHFASSITSIPSSCAFLSLEPAPGPAITRSVLADTEPETFAPSDSAWAFASSRDNVSRLPVNTSVLPLTDDARVSCTTSERKRGVQGKRV